ncbi:hypothetical protein [Mucilaginibacter sp. OK098]|uniref:hypothetical protein n=1 Tax=Mucilaginibacter sp. OK098 TaxID=1855297 RepID=UPI00091D7ED9|nr:hypothetical protein [Mucilaginibacter sp. OK098]SHN00354.1 hypothetical protein SAMN05216524_104514 [Mucilaginibacter sp. OK098]
MKLKLQYLLPLLAVLATGCIGGTNKNNNNVSPIPDGNYTGQFRLLHIHTNSTDTVKTNITLTLSNSAGTYKVTGDTATVHAGSYGNYAGNSATGLITFEDKTYSSSAPFTKTHLAGTYNYVYDGTVFQMKAIGALDTLELQYDLKKVTN